MYTYTHYTYIYIYMYICMYMYICIMYTPESATGVYEKRLNKKK